jgi:hypothetical protein
MSGYFILPEDLTPDVFAARFPEHVKAKVVYEKSQIIMVRQYRTVSKSLEAALVGSQVAAPNCSSFSGDSRLMGA